jgi:hypothetical protein
MALDVVYQLLDTCKLHGTSFKESGSTVRVTPEHAEQVRFFHIDDQSNPNCTLRRNLKIIGAICDLIVTYIRETRESLCLVESKGKNLEHAVEQIINTWRYLSQYLAQVLEAESFRQLEWMAYIYQHGSAPSQKTKKAHAELKASGQFSHFAISRNPDLGQFLRRK